MYLALALAIFASGALFASSDATTTYSIETTWDGEAIDHDPATVTLSTNPQGELVNTPSNSNTTIWELGILF